MRVPVLATAKRFSQQRRHRLLAACAAGVLVLAALGIAGWMERWPAALFGGGSGAGSVNDSASVSSAPAGAVMAVANLASGDLATVRQSVAAGYPVSAAVLAPAGTRVQVQTGTWRQRGENASLRARVVMPGQAPVSELIYLLRQEGRWRVLFTDPS